MIHIVHRAALGHIEASSAADLSTLVDLIVFLSRGAASNLHPWKINFGALENMHERNICDMPFRSHRNQSRACFYEYLDEFYPFRWWIYGFSFPVTETDESTASKVHFRGRYLDKVHTTEAQRTRPKVSYFTPLFARLWSRPALCAIWSRSNRKWMVISDSEPMRTNSPNKTSTVQKGLDIMIMDRPRHQCARNLSLVPLDDCMWKDRSIFFVNNNESIMKISLKMTDRSK